MRTRLSQSKLYYLVFSAKIVMNILLRSEGGAATTDVTSIVEKAENGEMTWKNCLETIINMDNSSFDQETHGSYGVTVEDKDVSLIIDVGGEGVTITEGIREGVSVSVNIQSSDLAGILKVSFLIGNIINYHYLITRGVCHLSRLISLEESPPQETSGS